jgi:hypothetical protein
LANQSEDILLYNTLTGFLINLLKNRGPMNFDDIEDEVKKFYSQMRKPNGQFYQSNMKKSIMGALSANGLFYQIKIKPKVTKAKRPSMLWKLKEDEANEYIKTEL